MSALVPVCLPGHQNDDGWLAFSLNVAGDAWMTLSHCSICAAEADLRVLSLSCSGRGNLLWQH